jgi:hypothetical protein
VATEWLSFLRLLSPPLAALVNHPLHWCYCASALTTAAVVAAVVTTMAVVTLAAAVVMVTADVRMMAMAVRLLAASGGGNNGTTTDVCDAIHLRYADIVDVGSNDDGNRAPTIDRGNIDGGAANFNNGMQCTCRRQ